MSEETDGQTTESIDARSQTTESIDARSQTTESIDARSQTTESIDARSITNGRAAGEVLRSSEPISFYGAVDLDTGEFVEEGHELEGENVAGRVLVFPRGKGSTVGSYVLYGLAKNGVAPAAIVNEETETIVATGAILGEIPCVDSPDAPLSTLADGERVVVDADAGRVIPDAERTESDSPSTEER